MSFLLFEVSVLHGWIKGNASGRDRDIIVQGINTKAKSKTFHGILSHGPPMKWTISIVLPNKLSPRH